MSEHGGEQGRPPYGRQAPPPYAGPVPPGGSAASWAGAGRPQYAPGPRTEDTAVWALVLAIASFAIFPVVPAIIALFLASSAERTIRESQQAPGGALGGQEMVRAARIVAWINLGIALAVVVLIVVVVLVLVAIGDA